MEDFQKQIQDLKEEIAELQIIAGIGMVFGLATFALVIGYLISNA